MSPLFLVSYIFLWAIVVLIGTALFILYSHVGERLVVSSREGHALQGPDLGTPVERKVLSALDGRPVTLGGASTKPRLIIYASVTCQPCRALLRVLPQLVERYAEHLAIVLVCRGTMSDVRTFTYGLPDAVAVCPDEMGELVRPYRILITPYALSLDRNGTLVYKGVPGSDLETLLHFVRPLVEREERPAAVMSRVAPVVELAGH